MTKFLINNLFNKILRFDTFCNCKYIAIQRMEKGVLLYFCVFLFIQIFNNNYFLAYVNAAQKLYKNFLIIKNNPQKYFLIAFSC